MSEIVDLTRRRVVGRGIARENKLYSCGLAHGALLASGKIQVHISNSLLVWPESPPDKHLHVYVSSPGHDAYLDFFFSSSFWAI
jgi:hypothetical protein